MPAARVARPAPVALKPPGLQSPAGLQRPAPRAAAAPRAAEPRWCLGLALAQRGEVEAAEAELRAAIDLEPGHADARFHLGVLLSSQDDDAGAEAACVLCRALRALAFGGRNGARASRRAPLADQLAATRARARAGTAARSRPTRFTPTRFATSARCSRRAETSMARTSGSRRPRPPRRRARARTRTSADCSRSAASCPKPRCAGSRAGGRARARA